MADKTRDDYIGEDYLAGMEINELSRTYGLTERRVGQILAEVGIPRRPRALTKKKSVSGAHVRLGLKLYTYRHEKGIELAEAAEDLNWSPIKIRKVENGTTEVELLDILDIAAYTQIKIGDLIW